MCDAAYGKISSESYKDVYICFIDQIISDKPCGVEFEKSTLTGIKVGVICKRIYFPESWTHKRYFIYASI